MYKKQIMDASHIQIMLPVPTPPLSSLIISSMPENPMLIQLEARKLFMYYFTRPFTYLL